MQALLISFEADFDISSKTLNYSFFDVFYYVTEKLDKKIIMQKTKQVIETLLKTNQHITYNTV